MEILMLLLVAIFFVVILTGLKKIYFIPYKNICERYEIAQKREKFKQEIITKIAMNDYELCEHRSWYYFNINGRREIFGIIELLDYFGEDVFSKAQLRKKEIERAEKKKSGLYLIVDNTRLN